VGPAVTVNVTSGSALVMITASLSNSNNNRRCYMAFQVSGATSTAPIDARSITYTAGPANSQDQVSAIYLVTGLTNGSNTFTAKYKASANTCTFANRNIIVTPY
jgi:hypothetical protein